MRTPTWRAGAVVLASLTLLSVRSARADDSFAPCWRGIAGTTYQNWFFAVSNNPAAPDVFTNANGTPLMTSTIGAFGTGWRATSPGGRTGLWDLGQAGLASLAVPNFGGSPAWKYVQVQVTYFDAPGFYLPPVVSISGATLVSSQTTNNQVVAPGNWRTYQTVWLIQPSPASETIVLTGDLLKGLLIDQIIVDTRVSASGDGDVPAFRPCWRGQTNTTFQQWLFGVSNNPASIPAELVTNAYGAPRATIVTGPASVGWVRDSPTLGCRQGIWDLGNSGTMTLSISNTSSGSGSSYKYVRLQVTQYRDSLHNTNATVAIAGGSFVSQQQQTIETTLSGQWIVAQSIWRLGPPCPSSESIVLTAGTNGSLIDQVVVDTVCLDVVCPTNITAIADAGQCSKSNVTWSLPALNGCTVTNITSTSTNGSTFPVGTNLVTSTIQDGEGFSRICNFTVTVSDTEPPAANCNNITVNLNGSGLASIAGADVNNGSTDNCGIASLAVNPNSFTCANIGSNGVTLTVTDVHGNSATCSSIVTVQDILPPTISCPTNILRTNDAGQCDAVVSFALPPGTDNCGVASVVAIPPSGSHFPCGTNAVLVVVTDINGNTNTCTFAITVKDMEPPVIACPADIAVPNDTNACGALVNYTAPTGTDNCPGALTTQIAGLPGGSFFPIGKTTNTFKVTDASSNSAQCSFVVTVNDTQNPQISCPGDITVPSDTNACGAVVNYTMPVGTDNCPGAVTTQMTGLPSGSLFPVGRTTNTFKVTDAANNSTQCSFTVTVTPQADLSLLVLGSGGPVTVGSNVTYTITLSNRGPCAAVAVVVSNSLSPGQVGTAVTNGLGHPCPVPGPEAWWRSEGDANDSAGTNNGTITGGVTFALGEVGQTFAFDGTSGSISVPDGPGLRPPSLTIEGWIRADDINSPRVIVEKRLGAGSNNSYSIRIDSGLLLAAIADNSGSGISISSPASAGQWIHVAYTFDSAAQAQALYVNGMLVNAGFVNKTIAYDAHPVLIGAGDNGGSPGFFYQGRIDELSLYNRALTGTEIKAIYNGSGAGKCLTPGWFALGDLPAGASTQLFVTAVPISCATASATASVSSGTADPIPTNDTSTAAIAIQNLTAEFSLSFQVSSQDASLLKLAWPLTCPPSVLQSSDDLNDPIVWNTANVPVELIDHEYSALVPINNGKKYFRIKIP